MSYKIEVIGLGAGDLAQLPLGMYRKMKQEDAVIFARTLDHPVVKDLTAEGVVFHGFDDIYESHDHFADVYDTIVAELIARSAHGPVIYAVPGHPMLAEKTVQLLLENSSLDVTILGGQSYLDDVFTALQIDPIDGFQFVDATSFKREDLAYGQHIIFSQVYDAFIASEVKLTLLEDLPETYEVIILEAVGTKAERQISVSLEELDRLMEMGNLTSIYVPPVPEELLSHQFTQFRKIIRLLRGPNGCPWDKRQTHDSLRRYLLEETYELLDAIDKQDDASMVEELGDVLLQVLLHSQIGEDDGFFTVDDVIQRITEKMIHRHPHVFGHGDPTKTWEELKQEEKPDHVTEGFLLDDVILHAPALQVAYQLQKKAAGIGFDWENINDLWEKFEEEHEEFTEAVVDQQQTDMEEEFGDLLFVLANIAKHYKIQPELALYKANKKFVSRLTDVEQQMRAQGKAFEQMTLTELDRLWDIAKKKERE